VRNVNEKRRRDLLAIIENNDLRAMIVASHDYRGHKGTLRYASGYNLPHRYGYALLTADGRLELVLGAGLRWAGVSHQADDVRYGPRLGHALADALEEAGVSHGRIGVVGLSEIMPTGDYLDLIARVPSLELVDVTSKFETLRSRKDQEDLMGVMEANHLAERGYHSVLGTVRGGISEQQVSARALETMVSQGGVDTILLVWSGNDGYCKPEYRVPDGRTLKEGDVWVYSIEVTGPRGYWVELARVMSIGRSPSPTVRQMHQAILRAMEAGARAMRPGAKGRDVQQAVEDAASQYGYKAGHLTGHGIGIDVIEPPLIARKSEWTLEEGMVLSMHPHVVDPTERWGLYMSDTWLVTPSGGEPLSDLSRDIWVIE